jgi:hypothetical protein
MNKTKMLVIIIGMILMSCSKKKDDNSPRNLSILGFLSSSSQSTKTESISLTGGVSVKQKISVTSGQELKYTLRQGSSSSGTPFENRVVISLLDTNNNEVFSTITIPGSSEILSYTPSTTGQFTVLIIPYNSTIMETLLTGATRISSNIQSVTQNSNILTKDTLVGKGKYYISGAFLQAVFPVFFVYEVQKLENRKPVLNTITDAIVVVEVNGTDYTLPYNPNPGFGVSAAYSIFNVGGSVIGKKVRVKITHPTISDLNFDQTISAVPNTVSSIALNGETSLNNSGKTIEIDKNLPITYTWVNSSNNSNEITVQLGIKDGEGGDIFIYVPANLGNYTISRDLLTGLTSTSLTNNDDCIGIVGGATSAAVYDPEYFTGLGTSGEAKSGFSVIVFNFPSPGYQPGEGFFCEENVVNNVAKQFLAGNPTFSSLGTPKLIIK